MKIEDLKTENLRFTDFETKKNKNGEKFHIMKVYTEDSSGKSRPIILDKKDVTALGLRKVLREGETLSHFYFSIIFGPTVKDEDWIKKFNDISNFIRMYVNKPEVKKQIGKKPGGVL